MYNQKLVRATEDTRPTKNRYKDKEINFVEHKNKEQLVNRCRLKIL